jgi:hypothetical protein
MSAEPAAKKRRAAASLSPLAAGETNAIFVIDRVKILRLSKLRCEPEICASTIVFARAALSN